MTLPLIARLIEREGGYGNLPDDKGGETKFGISKAQYPDLDIPSLTYDQAADIYLRDFYLKHDIDKIIDSHLQEALFDFLVNSGPVAIFKLQKVLQVARDGVIGPRTLAAIAASNPQELVNRLVIERILYIGQIKTPYTYGLLKRATSFFIL